jgi:CDP-6-deoxy-D-xylo-4-hexulose-3-dehydrase
MFWKLQEDALTEADLDALVHFIRSKAQFTQGPRIREFEQAYAKWMGSKFCVMVNSGSSANLLLVGAVKELKGWQDGDEVIVPAVTWPTTITPVMQCGLKPLYVDANLTDLSFDYDQLARKITPRTRGVFVAHLLGFPADMDRLLALARHHHLTLLEDCCESQGAKWKGEKVGNLGLAGTFSLYWGHHMTAIEGGLITTNSQELYHLLLLKRSHGLARELPPELHAGIAAKYPDIDFKFLFLTDGMNFRSTELNAILGMCQLARLDDFIRRRNHNFRRYVELCRRYPDDLIALDGAEVSSFALAFLFHDRATKAAFQKTIGEAGIESRPIIGGNLMRQPFLRQHYRPEEFPNADFLHENAFYIGNNQFVTDERMEVLDDLMRSCFARQPITT